MLLINPNKTRDLYITILLFDLFLNQICEAFLIIPHKNIHNKPEIGDFFMNFRTVFSVLIFALLIGSAFAQPNNPNQGESTTPPTIPPGQTLGTVPSPSPDQPPADDSGTSSGANSETSNTGTGSAGGGKPLVCSGVGYKMSTGETCSGKTTQSVFDGSCCSIPGTPEQAKAETPTVPAATETAPTASNAAVNETIPTPAPLESVQATSSGAASAPATGFAGLAANPQAIGLGFVILAVLLIAGYWFSTKNKK